MVTETTRVTVTVMVMVATLTVVAVMGMVVVTMVITESLEKLERCIDIRSGSDLIDTRNHLGSLDNIANVYLSCINVIKVA